MKTVVRSRKQKPVRNSSGRSTPSPKRKAQPDQAKKFAAFERYEADKQRLVENVLDTLTIKRLKGETTISDIARVSGVSHQAIRRLELGVTLFPRLDTVWKLCHAAGLKIKAE